MSAEEGSVFDVYRERVERPLYRLFTEYGPGRLKWMAVGMIANIIARGASLLPPLVLGVAIDSVLNNESPYTLPLVPNGWIPEGQTAQFWFSSELIVASFVVTGAFTWIYGVSANNFAHRVMHAVRTDSFATMQRLDMTFFDDKQTGEVMSVLNNDANNLENFLDNGLQNSVRLTVMIVGIAIILFSMNAQLALITLVAVPALFGLTVWFMRAVEPRYVDRRASVGNLNTRLENALSGVELVKTSGTESYESERVEDASWRYFRDTMAVLRLNYVYRPGMEMLAGLSFAVTFIVGGLWIFQSEAPWMLTGDLRTGEFVTFLFMTQRFVTPLSQVSNIIDQYENAKASSERIFGLMDIPSMIAEAEDPVELEDPEGGVEYDHVDFGYMGVEDDAPEELVLEDVSFEADPGDTVAFVGPTGAGKSTLLKLLMRLYDPIDGEVRIDGVDVRQLSLESLRSTIGYVSQSTFLFDGTVAENIRYGRFDAERGEVVKAAKAAEAHEFIESLPKGYDTRIGERGVKLSGGQQQRLSIARTMLQDPEILVLDEATSAVDTETEMLIQRSLDRLSENRTTFVIAHRLSTVRDADTILVLEDGEIVERGDHDELIREDGLYAKLWGVQAGEIDDLPEEFVERARQRAAERTDMLEEDTDVDDD
ncbi:ABC transporter ATP-binding protein [Halolamina salifodinae]|uniref:ATP-binding cassette subfamily B protein n=1 Tax=Halolamina salifodinae TaxID=1202767 RepID=A0A8T4GUM5_9EURY|nr:ABC transporter ATP-binding protein [Halolamina salifodinae]MBP1986569.1 ATP-binding cassette subfamily B protein [Halolamina salifodinae]